ncbi:MAG: hypothetical protein QXU67_06810, partial [Candidatus Bathyarchaeia archaeon]
MRLSDKIFLANLLVVCIVCISYLLNSITADFNCYRYFTVSIISVAAYALASGIFLSHESEKLEKKTTKFEALAQGRSGTPV